MKTIAEQIAALEATLAEKRKEMKAVLQRSIDENRSTDTAEAERFDTLKAEVKAIEADLVRMRELERMEAVSARSVDATDKENGTARPGVNVLQLKKEPPKLDQGIRFARYVRCIGLGYRMSRPPEDICAKLYPQDDYLHGMLVKAAVPAANTLDSGWASQLVSAEGGMFAEFLEWLRPQTIIGKFGLNGIPGFTTVPFRTPLISQASGGSAYWVGEGKPKPLTSWTYAKTTLAPLKVATIAVATMELLRDSSPAADGLIRTELGRAVRERLDIDFIDPGKAAVANVSPASILNGISAIPSSGSDAEDIRADIRTLFGTFIAANNAPTNGVWIMGAETALALSLLQNPLGQAEFPGVGMTGGTLFGLPVVVSQYAVRDTEGAVVALVNASDIWVADEGGLEVRASNEASIEMDNAPTNASAPSGAVVEQTLVSMFQTNSVAFLAERTMNWARARASAVAYMTGVTWGEAS